MQDKMSLHDLENRLEILTDRLDETVKYFHEYSQKWSALEAQLNHLDECIDEMKRKLFGSDFKDGILDLHEQRLNEIKQKWSYILGAAAAITFLVNTFVIVWTLFLKD